MAVCFAYAQRLLDEGRVPAAWHSHPVTLWPCRDGFKDWLVRFGIRMKLVGTSALVGHLAGIPVVLVDKPSNIIRETSTGVRLRRFGKKKDQDVWKLCLPASHSCG